MIRSLFFATLMFLLSSCASTKTSHPVEMTGLDCHMHVRPESNQDGKRVISELRSSGISHGCILSAGYKKNNNPSKFKNQKEYTSFLNSWTLKEANSNKRLIGFCSVPILAPWARDQVTNCINNGAKGLKLHLVSEKLSLQNANVRTALLKLFETTSGKLITLIHIESSDKEEVGSFFDLARQVPNSKIILAHGLAQNITLLKKAPANIYIEFSGITLAPKETGNYFIQYWRKFGIDRVLFGSDWPTFNLNPKKHLQYLNSYQLTDSEKKKILRDNAINIFGKDTFSIE